MLTIVVEIRLSFTIDYGGIGRDGLKKCVLGMDRTTFLVLILIHS